MAKLDGGAGGLFGGSGGGFFSGRGRLSLQFKAGASQEAESSERASFQEIATVETGRCVHVVIV